MTDHAVVLELSGLLKAGVPAEVARHELDSRLAKMTPTKFSEFEALWKLAIDSGGSVAVAMANLSENMLTDERHHRELELAFAGPRATARLIGWLPGGGLVIAQFFGLNPIGTIFTKPLAASSVAIGIGLLFGGWYWARSIIVKAQPVVGDPGFIYDAVRIGIDAGLPLSVAINLSIASSETHLGNRPSSEALAEIERIGVRNREAGASLAALLGSAARLVRDSRRFENDKKIAKLSVKLMIPLGLLTLPAFVCLAIAPIGISLLSSGQNL